jgi:NAD+ diphosphatase
MPKRANFYAESGLDRAAHLRGDTDWRERLIEGAAALIVPVWRSKNLIAGIDRDPLAGGVSPMTVRPSGNPEAAFLSVSEAAALLAAGGETVLLGTRGDTAYVAVDLSHHEDPAAVVPLDGRGAFTDLRAVGPLLDRNDGAVLAYARGMMTWHRRHLFCGACGSPTESRNAGHTRRCTNPDCAIEHFPRTDPAVIMLVIDGERCLLGRQAAWPPGMYSTLAGFVEPGETLEAAVAREVHEETGVRISEARYHSSQPWPFPSSIMLGFHAVAASTEIALNDAELEEARWFERDWIRAHEGKDGFRLPRLDSIARRLIEDWLAGETD